jgi:hypothetical protein
MIVRDAQRRGRLTGHLIEISHLNTRPRSAKWRLPMVKMCIFLEEFDPFRQLCWLAEGVARL